MISTLWLLAISALVGITVALWGRVLAPLSNIIFEKKERRVLQRLALYVGKIKEEKPRKIPPPSPILIFLPLARFLSKNKLAKKVKTDKKLKIKLRAAGALEYLLGKEFLFLKLIWAIVFPLLFWSLLLRQGFLAFLLIIVLIFLGYRIPDFFLENLLQKRRREIEKKLSEAIDLLAVSIEAGLGLERGLRLYCQRFQGALCEEFKKALTKIDLGQSRKQALLELTEANQVEELTLFISSILQAELLGTPLAQVLQEQAKSCRARQKQRVQEQIAKAPVKMLFPLAGLILPALFVVLIGPVVIKIIG